MKRGARNVLDAETLPARSESIVVPGRNCWRIERAERFRCVQDGDEYFRLVRAAILSAQHTIFILGWDITAGVNLLPGVSDASEPTRLGELLDFVAKRRRDLHCFVLIWDYAAVYALERDPLSRLRLGWGTHRRVRFRYDDKHPFGASHHQKIVVVDDRLAFSGGLDLTWHRWDTNEHRAQHPLRNTALGQPYTPFHDVQALVEGPVAASLGELARERWRRVGWSRLPPLRPRKESLWPADVDADLVDVDVAIARTEPDFRRRPAVRECEQLFLDSIAAARRTIYVENQYFTNVALAEAFAARLREEDGPELVILGPKECSGWLEEKTMGALRHEVLAKLTEADLHGRLRILYALASREADVCTFVHSKILVIDDESLRIGSANLSNRSMGMDTECDLVALASGDARIAAGIRRVRNRLIAEHIDASPEDIARAEERLGSLRAAIDELSRGDHALAPVEVDLNEKFEPWSTAHLADPNEPMRVTQAVDRLLPEIEASDEHSGRAVVALPLVAIVLGVLAAHRAAQPGRWMELAAVRDLLASAPSQPELWLDGLLTFVLGGLVFVPLELLTLGSVVLFGPLLGGAIALVGAHASAWLGYVAGRALGPKRLARIVGGRAARLWRVLSGRRRTTVAVLRLVSIWSDTIANLVCGAARVPPREYGLGTLIGLAPGMIALCVLGGLLRRTILSPGIVTGSMTIVAALVLAYAVLRMRRLILLRRLAPATLAQQERAEFG